MPLLRIVLMYQNLQLIRAAAALMVMLFHGAPQFQGTLEPAWLMTIISHAGYVGVDIFFAISGFVAAHTTLTRERAVGEMPVYAMHRLARIYLGYWPFYLLSLLIASIHAPHLLQQWDLLSSFFLFFLVGLSEPAAMVLYVSWSLSYELLFYGLVAASFVLPVQRARQALVVVTLGVAAALALAPNPAEPKALWTFLSFLLEFLLGANCRLLAPRLRGLGWLTAAAATAICAFAFGLSGEPPAAALRAFTLGVGAAGLVLFAVVTEQASWLKAPAWATELGASSYTLYLAHVPFWSILGYLGVSTWIAGWPPILRETGFWLAVIVCVAASHVFYRLVEAPMYRRAIGRINQS